LEQVHELERTTWFSPLTNRLEIMYTTYNAHQGTLGATFVFVYLNRAGHIYKDVEPMSIWVDPYHCTWRTYVLDGVWLLLVLKTLVEEGSDLIKHVILLGLRRGLSQYMTVYNFVDWVNIIFSITIVSMWILHLGRLGKLYDIIKRADVDVPGSWEDQADLEAFFELVHVMMRKAYEFRIIVAMYQFLIAFRFFKAFDVQPCLSLVTRTISSALVSIIHFGVVFFTIFFIFVVSAMVLFGQEVLHFTYIGRASHTTFRILLGDFDWEDLHTVGRAQSVVWFWALVWLLNLILLNLFLGIILDTYSDVKNEVMSHPGVETLWSQAIEIYERKKKVASGVCVSLPYILKMLDPTDLDDTDDATDHEKITVSSFVEQVPGLGDEQAEEILLTALEYYGEDSVEASEVETFSSASSVPRSFNYLSALIIAPLGRI